MILGGHIKLQKDGPWVKKGPPVISRFIQIVGSCALINSQGGGCQARVGAKPGAGRNGGAWTLHGRWPLLSYQVFLPLTWDASGAVHSRSTGLAGAA